MNDDGDIHTYPLNDLREHIVDRPGCPCNPRIKILGGATLHYIHNAWDKREIIEQAIDIMNGEDDEEEDGD